MEPPLAAAVLFRRGVGVAPSVALLRRMLNRLRRLLSARCVDDALAPPAPGESLGTGESERELGHAGSAAAEAHGTQARARSWARAAYCGAVRLRLQRDGRSVGESVAEREVVFRCRRENACPT